MSRVFEIVKSPDRSALVNILLIGKGVVLRSMPGILADMTSREIDKMKDIIGKNMLFCEDDDVKDLLKDIHLFFEHQPFEYTVWRLFSVNTSMNVVAFKMVVSYTLAMIQFAHFFG
ncbi:uncharacterized protein LOC124632829 [Helicoverpa zea]|uniref:uncharacterized protein LOC124632829 n=1 Tax=Helicoverpa zea TaxID=7113 RepID=UPI001F59A95B|nr:uncharacterized protein LOC124632829 [Helicoverpa zea]